MKLYKATRPDGTDFHTGKIQYNVGEVTIHPQTTPVRDNPSTYLSASTVPTDCTGCRWPARLFLVEPVGRNVLTSSQYPNKRAACKLRVLEELPAYQLFGPQGEAVVEIIRMCSDPTLPWQQFRAAARGTAWAAARDAAWAAARGTAWAAARGTAWAAAGGTAWAAAGVIVADLMSDDHLKLLYGPWCEVFGMIEIPV